MEMRNVVQAVENYVAQGNLEKGILLLRDQLEVVNKPLYHEVLHLSARFKNIQQERIKGMISRDQEEAGRSQTAQTLLDILRKLEELETGLEKESENPSLPATEIAISQPQPPVVSTFAAPPIYSQPAPEKVILHMDLDAFFVSVERMRDSRLNGLPLIIGGSGERGVVASCSYEARTFGVHAAMPMRLARKICPQAIVISGDYDAYTHYSHMVTDVIGETAPLYEKASIDEFYIDMTGMERFFGCWKWATEMKARIGTETGLPISFGLSINKLVSKIATNESKPNGQREVAETEIPSFLDPMPVRKIPMVGEKTAQDLTYMGIRSVKMLRQIPREVLTYIYGKPGNMLWERSRGIDGSPVVPYSDKKSISTESAFPKDTIDVIFLRSTLTRMVEELAFKLRKDQKLCACVSVKLRYSNFDTVTRQARIAYTANDEVLIRKVLTLFDKLYQRRLLVRLVGVKFTQMVYGGHQVALFEDTEQKIDLYQAVDEIKHKFGTGAIKRASGINGKKAQPG
ncbi:DNA polymerase IV [bacterium]|nr:DNA polymerase IV [bacterium]